MDYQNDIKIDPDRLDIMWMRQGELSMEYGEALADAKDHTRRCHQSVKLIRSSLILKAKKGLCIDECGSKKPSDSVCEAYYRTHPDYVEAVEDHIDALKEEDILQQAVYAISGRKAAMEHLVRLLHMQYFTGPVEPHTLTNMDYDDFSKSVEDKTEKSKSKTTERLAGSRRRRRK